MMWPFRSVPSLRKRRRPRDVWKHSGRYSTGHVGKPLRSAIPSREHDRRRYRLRENQR